MFVGTDGLLDGGKTSWQMVQKDPKAWLEKHRSAVQSALRSNKVYTQPRVRPGPTQY